MNRGEAFAELTKPGAAFEMADADVNGVPMRVWAKTSPTLGGLLEGTRKHGDRDFIVYADERYTFADHVELVAGFAQWLAAERGVGKGDRVAIGMRNYPEWIITFWAVQVLGAVAVPLNAWWTGPELRYALEDSGSTLAVVDGERYERMAGDLVELSVPSVVVRHGGDVGARAVHWADVAARFDRSATMPTVEVAPDDDATIVYTSGTTGRPKGAVATHRNHVTTFLNTAFAGAVDAMKAARPDSSPASRASASPPCSLMTYPFFHIGGLSTIYISTGFRVKMVLQYRWDLEEALALIERERVTSLAAVPTLLRQLLDSPLVERYDISSLGTLGSGGAPVPPDLVRRVDRKFASSVAPSNGYGLTETTSAATLNRGQDYLDRPTSVGRPFPVVDVGVVDADSGRHLGPGAVGELWFRGPNVARGYWNDPGATAEAFSDGWFHTGDLGSVDEDGFVYVVDRLKDVVIRAGENVYCAEVEAALFEHAAVADVAVVGVPHAELGEEVAAVVQLKEGATASAANLQDHVSARLAHFKVPAHVVFRAGPLPRTATGKVLKRELRDELSRQDAHG
jgi:long-chain acyl-CoA synthetase